MESMGVVVRRYIDCLILLIPSVVIVVLNKILIPTNHKTLLPVWPSPSSKQLYLDKLFSTPAGPSWNPKIDLLQPPTVADQNLL